MERPSYVLPLRWRDDAGLAELTDYLRRLAGLVDVIVVDGSPPELFERHRRAWHSLARHVPPDPSRRSRMGKVDGVMTGVELAGNDKVVIADDDVRYGAASLARVVALLDEADLVWPQNYFDPLPWHARWDTARSLLNRAVSHDYPGTVGVRRSTLLEAGGYDGDLMFENLELRRTISASGGRLATPLDLFVRRLPPPTRHFLSQRVRQAYDDIALPLRLGAFLAVGPAVAAAASRRRLSMVGVGAAGLIALAEVGRRRAGGREVFPATSALWAPAWVAERAVTSWIALWERFARGGVRYGDGRIRSAATSRRVLTRRAAQAAQAQLPEERARLI
jgi:hypothetical protein